MAALTEDDIAAIKSWVGSGWSEDDIEERYARLQDQDEVVLEILNQQIADVNAQPTSFSVPGLSISNGQQAQYLGETIKRFNASGGLDDEANGGTGGPVKFLKAFRPDYNRMAR
jgi:hypothetical protein